MPPRDQGNGKRPPPQINSITVSGFKSLETEQSIEVRPLTLLAGANSSGKSSLMQPVLLLKQTLEASYDPGPLLLNGPNVRFTSAEQFLVRGAGAGETNDFLIRIGLRADESVEVVFVRQPGKRLEVQHCRFRFPSRPDLTISRDMKEKDIRQASVAALFNPKVLGIPPEVPLKWKVARDRFFLRPAMQVQTPEGREGVLIDPLTVNVNSFGQLILDVIHLPGLRGNPERAYPLTATGPEFPGTFEKYTASIVAGWSGNSPERLDQLGNDLNTLGLTWKVEAKAVDDTQIELRVGRLLNPQRRGGRDLVNIADVGFGVSQALPVVTALLAARPGQLVYLEQPEIHLHPRAQVAMAEVLANAANRGVQVVAETHSFPLLIGVQSLVAEGKLAPDKVKLHWFSRNKDGATTVTSGDLDEAGAFGDWPEDFSEVDLNTDSRYIDAAHARLKAASKNG